MVPEISLLSLSAMKISFSPVIVAIITLNILLSAWLLMRSYSSAQKLGFIRTYDLYNSFLLTNHFQEQLQGIKQNRQSILDSLKTAISKMELQINNNSVSVELRSMYNSLTRNYMESKEAFDKQITEVTADYDGQIWVEINSGIVQFGKDEGYDFIFGAEGTGSLLHADSADDLTEKAIAYLNNRYVNGETE